MKSATWLLEYAKNVYSQTGEDSCQIKTYGALSLELGMVSF
jgi:hypothetical protein